MLQLSLDVQIDGAGWLVSEGYPHHESRAGTGEACERSLRRLGLERIDVYLLHWRGAHPPAETVAAMHALQAAGRIGRWGVSNFDVENMEELLAADGADCALNQVRYSLGERGPEHGLHRLRKVSSCSHPAKGFKAPKFSESGSIGTRYREQMRSPRPEASAVPRSKRRSQILGGA